MALYHIFPNARVVRVLNWMMMMLMKEDVVVLWLMVVRYVDES